LICSVKNLKRDAVEQLAQARLAADLAAADVARRHAEREAMLVAELTQPIDETSDPEYFLWFLQNLDGAVGSRGGGIITGLSPEKDQERDAPIRRPALMK
jgi:hypothetical protein